MRSTRSARARCPILPALVGLLVTIALTAATPALAEISVSEFGVGTAVEQRELKGKAQSFPEGSKVFFWTRVVGGSEGDRIHHVWIHGDHEVTIGLHVGGPHWRTYSSKTLHRGMTGAWAVEARDADGRVLARQEFSCTPAADPEESDAGGAASD